MKVLVAVDSFKGSLSSTEIGNVIEEGVHEIDNQILVEKTPIADGGEGTHETLVEGLGGETIRITVNNPVYNPVEAEYGVLKDGTAVIEMAQSSGLPLLSEEERNPLYTTTYGVGELISDALKRGVRNFIIGIGGSATNDGGIGMLNALGYEFLDENNQPLKGIGISLEKIKNVDSSKANPELAETEFLIACDVDNPFFGERGAAHVYAKQKGASPEEIVQLDQGLRNFSDVIKESCSKDISELKGAGAAGGLGGGFVAFLNAQLMPGTDIIFEKIGLEEKIKNADIVITGEGRMDFQTVMNKAPIGVAKLCKKHNVKCIGISASVTDDAFNTHDLGLTAVFSIINEIISLDEAMKKERASLNLKNTTKEIFRLLTL